LSPGPTQFFLAEDGTRLAWREMGEGRPLILLHGYFSNAQTNWIAYGTAEKITAAGFRLIMPDLRAHGESDRPRDPERYPPDVLASDGVALIAHLGLSDYDLGGYSLGGRTVVRMLVRGSKPRRAIVSGMGLKGLTETGTRSAHFRHVLENLGSHAKGSPEWMAEAFLKSMGGDAVALRLTLDSFVDTALEDIQGLATPVGVICGVDDADNGSAADLASELANAELITIPGNHMSAVTKVEFGREITKYLTE
jgi:pimeloyl-ACP methyl ester carboxylesterase